MSNIPSWWDKTITVYNKCVSIDTNIITWRKTVIDNCFWKHSIEKVAIDNAISDKDVIVCRIWQQDNFITPFDWVNMEEPNEDTFTLQPKDIIVLGNCDEEIDEYQKGLRSTDLLNKYRKICGCMEISSVSINTMTGMNNPHYNVRGY